MNNVNSINNLVTKISGSSSISDEELMVGLDATIPIANGDRRAAYAAAAEALKAEAAAAWCERLGARDSAARERLQQRLECLERLEAVAWKLHDRYAGCGGWWQSATDARAESSRRLEAHRLASAHAEAIAKPVAASINSLAERLDRLNRAVESLDRRAAAVERAATVAAAAVASAAEAYASAEARAHWRTEVRPTGGRAYKA